MGPDQGQLLEAVEHASDVAHARHLSNVRGSQAGEVEGAQQCEHVSLLLVEHLVQETAELLRAASHGKIRRDVGELETQLSDEGSHMQQA